MARPSRQRAYGQNLPLIDVFPFPIFSASTPGASDKEYEIGQVWVKNISSSSRSSYIYGGLNGSGDAIWILSAPGASDVDTLTGDSGGAISPAGGDIILAGGTNVTTAGAGSTITFNLDATVVLATSMSSPIYTVAAATDLNINSSTGQDLILKMGDNAGANKVSFTDSDDAEVFAIDSNGSITYTSLTVAGAFTQTAGVVSISEDNSANAVGIANGTTARAVTLASSAAAHTVSIGSATGAASLDLRAGTGNFTLEGGTATTYDISATGVNTGTITIAGGTGAQQIDIATGGTGAKTVNIGSGAIGNIVTIGSVTAAASLDLLCGTGNFTLEGNVASTYDISNTGANTGAVNIAGGTGARSITIGGGGTGAKTINLGAAASADVITIGDATGAGSLDLVCGTGNFTLEGNVASTYDISSTGVNTGTVTIGAGTGARTVNLATGGTGVKTVNLATGAIGNIVTIGTVSAAASLDLLCGTGNFTVEGNVASTYEISSTGVNTGTCKFASGTGARTVEIAGGGTGIKTVNIGAAATADVITIGTTTGAGSTTIAAGTGRITVSGTVKEIDAEFLFSSGTDLTITQSPVMTTAATTGGVPTGATGDINLMSLQDGCLMETMVLGAGQTIIAPRMTSNAGLNIALDQVDNEGALYNFGPRNSAKHAYTVGTAAAFFMEATFTVADVSGCDPLYIGFRKVEANQADFNSYTDRAFIGLDATVSPGNVVLNTELNSGGSTTTNTTDAWADAASHTIKVLVSAAGVVTYTIDGSAPSATAAFTFDNGDIIMPEIFFLNGADVAGDVEIETLKIGFQS